MNLIDYSSHFDARLLTTLVLSGLAATLMVAAKKVPKDVFFWLKRKMVSSVTVDSTCEAYHLLNEWIEAQDFAKKSRSLMLESIKSESRAITSSAEDKFMSGRLSSWRISVAQGTYLFWHRKTLFFYTKSTSREGNDKKPLHQSTLVGFTRNREKVMEVLDFCHNLLTDDHGLISIYSYSFYWQLVDRRRSRSLDTIFLRDGQIERILKDIDWWKSSEEWYLERGIPYRRGYLFEGPPGTGKTSTILGLATHYKRPVYLLSLSSISSDTSLMDAIRSTPKDAFVVLEDVDCAKATTARKEKKIAKSSDEVEISAPADEEDADDSKGVTLAGLLNALDGITTPEQRLYFMTTNYPENLDSALIRPGRVDMREHIGLLGAREQERMAHRFYRDQPFAGLPVEIAPAHLLKAFMQHPTDAAAAKEVLLEEHA